MCGIAGLLAGSDSPRVEVAALRAMGDAMMHRGPDGAGLWIDPTGRVGLAHRRLAIVDLSPSGAQPMTDEEAGLALSFNGEIYNHADLRAELEALGHVFRGLSDTEVILKAYRAWGRDCIHRFRGMFAFALWDGGLESLWLVRDRIGIKPLYYARTAAGLAFGSEIKAILADRAVPRRVNEEALFHYLSFLTVPAPATLFEGIEKLPGGCMLIATPDGAVEVSRWWDVLQERTEAPSDGPALDAGILAELREAVRLRQMADVPVGVFLSGGIDSTTNLALFAENRSEPVQSFSIGYEGDYASYGDELPFAGIAARAFGARHHELRLKPDDLRALLPRIVALQDEPIADPVCFPLYCVSRLARQAGVIVCQVGEGADELFWGYPNWRRALRLQRLADAVPAPRILKRLGLALLAALGKDRSQPHDWLARSADGRPIFWGGAEAFTHAEKMRLLSPRLRQAFAGRSSWEAIAPIRERFLRGGGRSNLDWMSYLDLNFRLPELLLMRVDKMSMGVGLEARVPFLDHRFVGLAMSIPEAVKTKGLELKRLLKRAVRGLIPDAIIDRRKQGFGLPLQEWLLQGLGSEIRATVDRFLDRTDFLDRDAARAILDDPNGRTHAWYIVNLALWWAFYIEPDEVGLVPLDPEFTPPAINPAYADDSSH